MKAPTYSVSTEPGTGRFLGMSQDQGGCWVPLSHIETVLNAGAERDRVREGLLAEISKLFSYEAHITEDDLREIVLRICSADED